MCHVLWAARGLLTQKEGEGKIATIYTVCIESNKLVLNEHHAFNEQRKMLEFILRRCNIKSRLKLDQAL